MQATRARAVPMGAGLGETRTPMGETDAGYAVTRTRLSTTRALGGARARLQPTFQRIRRTRQGMLRVSAGVPSIERRVPFTAPRKQTTRAGVFLTFLIFLLLSL